MKTLVLLILSISTLSSFNIPFTSGDKCTEWTSFKATGRESKLYFKICENESGGSGYTMIKNENNMAVSLKYVINFKNGTSTSGSKSSIPANSETTRSSCFGCAQKNGGGIESWSFENIKFEGE